MAAPTVVVCPNCGKRNRVPPAANGTVRCGNCPEPLPWIAEAGDGDFGEVVEAASIPVLVDLWAPWCGPCQWVSPTLEELARTHAGRVKLVKVNVDEAPAIAERFGVRGIPTLLVLNKGEVVDRQIGAAPENVLREWLDRALATIV